MKKITRKVRSHALNDVSVLAWFGGDDALVKDKD